MVSSAGLRDARPALWQTAADDLKAVASQADRTADNIHANGAEPLDSSWPDRTGSLARGELVKHANRMTNIGVLSSGAASAVDTLQDAVAMVQRQLLAAVDDAVAAGFTVGDDGRIHLNPHSLTLVEDGLKAAKLQLVIDDAVEAATQADQPCVHALDTVSLDPDTVSTDQAQSAQSQAVKDALQEMRDQLPDGLPADEVATWWAKLSREQQQQLMRAVPVELHDLPGIPQAVKDELSNTGQGYDPLAAVRWAMQNANNEGIDRFPFNCAHFVSETLAAAGLDSKFDISEAEAWYKLPGSDYVPRDLTFRGRDADRATHSDSWSAADPQREFFLNNGGADVGLSNARPGDVVYPNYESPRNGESSHHAPGRRLADPKSASIIIPNSYRPREMPSPRWVGIHTSEGRNRARGLVECCRAHEVAYNRIGDDREIIEAVADDDAPWAAVGANKYAWHYCFATSFASWSRDQWLDPHPADGYNEREALRLGAKQVAYWIQKSHDLGRPIPAVWIGGRGRPPWGADGICGHVDFGAWGGGHTDPGVNFPINVFLDDISAELTGVASPPLPPLPPVPAPGTNPDRYADWLPYQGNPANDPGRVAAVQRAMNRPPTPYGLDIDGVFGSATRQSVIGFQEASGGERAGCQRPGNSCSDGGRRPPHALRNAAQDCRFDCRETSANVAAQRGSGPSRQFHRGRPSIHSGAE
ncbi:amidase domain-containing protein [Mycobacterium sp. MYCO198283]|uniref:amidase domain-containing protein n=1 Tax=Mycobacterium sp. MYCO198283 TaxID=2883505 RepID=UPI001E30EF32|nr:amidase domain-containing protein [Mycobacterium sp. MYCO198283]MCG5432526.1 amidase domain-containing protein [Mycobacterium sp. MYCO198283]